jgi:zinc finger protein
MLFTGRDGGSKGLLAHRHADFFLRPPNFISDQFLTEVWETLALASLKETNNMLRCPSCDAESIVSSQSEYKVEHFGSVLIIVSTCQKCGYRHTDVMTLTTREPTALSAKITTVDDLNIRVIKSGTATVSIPEFGATITPGPYSEGFITNVEGILERIEDALTFMLTSTTGKRLAKGEKMLKQLEMMKEKPRKFTLVIKDPFGNSALVSPDSTKVQKRRLTEQELLKTKYGQYVVDHRTIQQ